MGKIHIIVGANKVGYTNYAKQLLDKSKKEGKIIFVFDKHDENSEEKLLNYFKKNIIVKDDF